MPCVHRERRKKRSTGVQSGGGKRSTRKKWDKVRKVLHREGKEVRLVCVCALSPPRDEASKCVQREGKRGEKRGKWDKERKGSHREGKRGQIGLCVRFVTAARRSVVRRVVRNGIL